MAFNQINTKTDKNNSTPGFDRRYWTAGFHQPSSNSFLQHILVKLVCIAYLSIVGILHLALSLRLRKKPTDKSHEEGITVFAIGPFFSENWSMAHMEALCKADIVKTVHLFTPARYKPIEKLQYVTHQPRAAAWFGSGVARALSAFRLAIKIRPNLVIGYHLPWNGLISLLVAKSIGSKAVYFSVGGPPEIIGGGIYSEHPLFSRLRREDPYIERLLISLLRKFDGILTMGTRSQNFFRNFFDTIPIVPLAVGINDRRFSSDRRRNGSVVEFDLVSVGRLSKIKRIDKFLQIIARLAENGTIVRAAIVGDGEQMDRLRTLAVDLQIVDKVRFLGWIDNVEEILTHSKIFVMTSSSEGLPHSLIEAMLTGLPAIVPQVGEIGDLVKDKSNGHVVANIDEFVDRISTLLASDSMLAQFGVNARTSALKYTIDPRIDIWNNTLERLFPTQRLN